MDKLAFVFFLAFLAESLTEYLFGTPIDKVPTLKQYRWALMYVSMLVGVGLSFAYGVDLVNMIFGVATSWVSVLLSGIVIGRGSNFLHELVSKYITKRYVS